MTTREASLAKIAEVLRDHPWYGTPERDCGCGWESGEVMLTLAREAHAAHQAEALASAGIGWAGALSDDDVQSVCEDRPEWPNGFRAALGRAFGAKED